MRVRVLAPGTAVGTLLTVLMLNPLPGCSGVSEEQRVRSERQYELALSYYRDEGDASRAVVALEQALRLNPDNADASLLLGELHGGAGRYAEAERELRRAVDLLRVEAANNPERVALLDEAKNSLGAALVDLGRPADALPLFNDVVGDMHYAPQHLALANLGLAQIALGQNREAAQTLERAVAGRADFCVGNYRLGQAYLNLEDYGQALAALDRALGTTAAGCNRIQAAYRARGEVHAHLHQPDAARADFTRCRDLDGASRDGQFCAASLRTAEQHPPKPQATHLEGPATRTPRIPVDARAGASRIARADFPEG